MEEIIKAIKNLGIPMIVIVFIALLIASYKNYLQIRFYDLSIQRLIQQIKKDSPELINGE